MQCDELLRIHVRRGVCKVAPKTYLKGKLPIEVRRVTCPTSSLAGVLIFCIITSIEACSCSRITAPSIVILAISLLDHFFLSSYSSASRIRNKHSYNRYNEQGGWYDGSYGF